MKISNQNDNNEYRNIWIIAETEHSSGCCLINPVAHEIAGKGRNLADIRKVQLWIIVMGSLNSTDNYESYRKEFFYADHVVLADNKNLSGFHDESEAALLNRLINKYKPEAVLFSATARGRSLAPRTAVLADAGLTADCTSLDIEESSGNLLQTRPAFGGNIIATIKSEKHRPQMATVRPGVMKNFIIENTNTDLSLPELTIENPDKNELALLKTILSTKNEAELSIR